jgi:hypothetical protein
MKKENHTPDDTVGLAMSGHILVRDKETGEELINKRNAIHYGNMARIVAQALNNTPEARIYYMAFGNGGTSVDTTGKIIYKSPRVSEAFESSANLYSRTYKKIVGLNTDTDKIEVITGTAYTDLKITCTLGYNEPSDQDLFDSSTTNEGDYIFDELALFNYPTDPSPTDGSDPIDSSRMLTHVIFHPVQKSLNRVIEVIYTVRVQLS